MPTAVQASVQLCHVLGCYRAVYMEQLNRKSLCVFLVIVSTLTEAEELKTKLLPVTRTN